MKKKDLERLSQLGNVSVSTISKVIHHCPGVDNGTRQRILELAERQHLYPETEVYRPLHAILPDNPKYYWRDLYLGLRDEGETGECRFDIYTRLTGAEPILHRYLEEAKAAPASLIVIAATDDALIESDLHALSQQMPIFLLTEYLEIPHSVFFGADSYTDALRLGEHFAANWPERSKILCLTDTSSGAQRKRVEGFFTAVRKGPPRIAELPHQQPLAANIARLLYSAWQEEPFDSVYCTDGLLPFVCQSVQKAGLSDRVVCVGHENPQANEPFLRSGLLACSIEQNGYEQGALAMRCAREYLRTGQLPDRPIVYVPSRLISLRGEKP